MNDVVEPKTLDDLFRAFGGTSSLGRVIGKGQSTASEMRRRGNIPVAYWPRLIEAAAQATPRIRLTAEVLMEMHQRVPAPASDPPPAQAPATAVA